MNKTTVAQQSKTATFLPPAQGILQRKCASCGNHTVAGGECTGCAKQKSGLQRKLAIGASNDPLEREADRIADAVVAGEMPPFSASAAPIGRVQREDAPKEKTNEEKYEEGIAKLGEAFLKTPLGKELLEKIKQDTLVKGATELSKDFIGTLPGKIITGVAATGAVATLAATHKELPAQIPEIPLDVLMPGLSVQITYKGTVDKPTEAMISFKFSEQAPKGGGDKQPALSAAEKYRAETARMSAADAKFRAGMTYTPGSPEDLQQKAEQEAVKSTVAKYAGGPDLNAMVKQYPWLVVPQPTAGLQLTMPKPSFGSQPPSLFGDQFKLKLPSEQKKKEDEPGLQRKLTIGESKDPLEQEADRIADQVLAAPSHSAVSGAPPRIQRFAGQATGEVDTVPTSVERVLTSSGRPLDPALQQDMGQRFGHDFSQVRVHSGAAAEQSAQDVSASAYTVGHNIVFGTGRFAPGSSEGQRLIAHELTHVVQQGASPLARGHSDSRTQSGSEITIQNPVAVRCSERVLRRDGIVDRVRSAVDPATRQFLSDLTASVRQSPEHFVEFFTGELLEAVKAHWLRIALVTLGLFGAQLVIGGLEAAPTGITQIIGAILEVVVLAVLGYFAAVEVVGAAEEGIRWWSTARKANGNPKEIAEASRAFVRMVWHIFMAVLAVAGVRARVRAGAVPRITAPLRTVPPVEAPPVVVPSSPPPSVTPPARQLTQGSNPPVTPPARQLTEGENPPVTPPARQLTEGEKPKIEPPIKTEPSNRVVEQKIKDPNIRAGSGEQWTGKNEPPQWDNPKSTKAYDHIESTHGPKVKPDQFKGRLETGEPEQGQWYNAEDWVKAEKLAGKSPGTYVIDFGRPVGRVYRAGSNTPVEGVTRAFVQRNPDGSLNSGYPVTDNFKLR